MSKPILLLVAGPPGSGKSTLSREISAQAAVPVIDKDTIKSSLLALGADSDLASRASYTLLLSLATDILKSGIPVILDAPGKYRSFIDDCQEHADLCNATFRCVLCHTSLEVRRERLEKRSTRESQWSALPSGSVDDLDEWLAILPTDVEIIDTMHRPENLANKIITWLRWEDRKKVDNERGI